MRSIEAANRVTSTCWYQRRRGAFGVDSSTRGRVAERDLNQAYPLGVALGINFSFLLSLCVWACQRRADALLSVGDYSAALKDLEALQCMGCTDTASRLADCRHRFRRRAEICFPAGANNAHVLWIQESFADPRSRCSVKSPLRRVRI